MTYNVFSGTLSLTQRQPFSAGCTEYDNYQKLASMLYEMKTTEEII